MYSVFGLLRNKPDNGLWGRGIAACRFLSGLERYAHQIEQRGLGFVVFAAVNKIGKGLFKRIGFHCYHPPLSCRTA